jgi:hypothetical protein
MKAYVRGHEIHLRDGGVATWAVKQPDHERRPAGRVAATRTARRFVWPFSTMNDGIVVDGGILMVLCGTSCS